MCLQLFSMIPNITFTRNNFCKNNITFLLTEIIVLGVHVKFVIYQ